MRSDAVSKARPPRAPGRGRLVAGIVVGVAAADQATKSWVVATLSDEPRSIIGTTVELRLSRNPGGAFSLFQRFTPVLAILACLVAVVLVRAVRRTSDRVLLIGLGLVLAGAVGNLLDRVFRSPGFLRGAVVDFISVGSWPSFNVADSAITIGAGLLILRAWRGPREA